MLRVLVSSCIISSALVTATVEDIDKSWQAAISEVKSTNVTRTFDSSWAQDTISSIINYGCWCYFQGNHGSGRGQPVNEVDNQCRILHDGYECAVMDGEDEGKECVPWDVPYKSATGLGLVADLVENDSLEEALRTRCFKSNKKNKCAARACIVENYFVVSLVKLFLSSVKFDTRPKHSLGKFDPAKKCPVKNGFFSEKECCGLYPIRFPFKTMDGDRGCCVDRTFNAALMKCCDDGSVGLSC